MISLLIKPFGELDSDARVGKGIGIYDPGTSASLQPSAFSLALRAVSCSLRSRLLVLSFYLGWLRQPGKVRDSVETENDPGTEIVNTVRILPYIRKGGYRLNRPHPVRRYAHWRLSFSSLKYPSYFNQPKFP